MCFYKVIKVRLPTSSSEENFKSPLKCLGIMLHLPIKKNLINLSKKQSSVTSQKVMILL